VTSILTQPPFPAEPNPKHTLVVRLDRKPIMQSLNPEGVVVQSFRYGNGLPGLTLHRAIFRRDRRGSVVDFTQNEIAALKGHFRQELEAETRADILAQITELLE